ncbi:MAG TPA: hypothetical protein PKV72_04290 [Candidatus Peribacteria bacterium]|nr:hypothetical protein [Candidatus Peribacteria bacterium]
MKTSDRASAFLEHVQQTSFVCGIGAAMARQGRLPLFEMPEAVEGRAEVARDAIRELLSSGRGAAVGVLYPSEPADYQALKTMHTDVHATVVAACAAESAKCANAAGTFRLPRAGKDIPRPLLPLLAQVVRGEHTAKYVAYEGTELLSKMCVKVEADPYRSFDDIRAAVRALLAVDPNIAPGVGGNVLQAIVMSPQYTGDTSDELRALLAKSGMPDLPHGRHAPATAMIINYHADVMEARATRTGQGIRQRMTMGASVTRYDPMHVLAEKPDAAVRHAKLLTMLQALRRDDGKQA